MGIPSLDYLCYRFNLILFVYLLEFDLDSIAEFFAQLSTKVCVLALNSSLVDLVHYTRQGLQRLKQAPKAP